MKKKYPSGYQRVSADKNRSRVRKGFTLSGEVSCKGCFEKKHELDLLKAENQKLKQKIKYMETGGKAETRATEGAHTPSSRIQYKANAGEENQKKTGGGKPGHKGHGRKSFNETEACDLSDLKMPECCTECEVPLEYKDKIKRSVLECEPIKVKKVIYKCARGTCPNCFKVYTAKPNALPKSLYGNSVMTQASVLHFIHGLPLAKVRSLMGVNITEGGIIHAIQRLGDLCEPAIPKLIEEYRQSDVKHADETGWRTDGESGYAWIFCTDQTTVFEFRDTRSSVVSREVLGEESLPGVLVVDRYPGYNKTPIAIQYCYAHLLREVEKLEDEFNDDLKVTRFTSELATLLAQAMKLRNKGLNIEAFKNEAERIKTAIEAVIYTENTHLGVKKIQSIFKEKRDRLYHWVKDPRIPTENNRAERELRPTVVARKVSFGSQSKKGARTRAVLMSVLYTVKKRLKDKSVDDWLLESLNAIVKNPNLTLADLLPSPTGN